ncbi:RCC1 domain-containing protein [Dyadobacter psychrophilus]|uniref:Por secretion system C-terminal sorting domain-containing protein n=1 Tax=Dyadobacter psychrophilus TaxID=651661 RepID=A0A1T5H0H5_9BACT|nr:T9SS type A sorting domain-containing protein [Dyadobacter psychrophilus]SKC14091.1 Por secretion system C-terminal sorting domain-containing protein [Dyadobacter psychrophilus]
MGSGSLAQCIEFTSIATGPIARHTLGIKSDGTLWSWGENTSGQLGIGSNINQNIPVQVGIASDWMSVSAGQDYTIAIKNNGTLWAWGANSAGQLGIGVSSDQNFPTQVGNDANWKIVSTGGLHVVAIRTDGSLWAWGSNIFGQVGDLSFTNKQAPVRIGNASDWSTVLTGEGHSGAIKSDGSLWTWGRNNEGQLGNGPGSNSNQPRQVGNDNNWKSVVAGSVHTLGIKNNGTLWGWGANAAGQLGTGLNLDMNTPQQIGSSTNWASVSSGLEHSLGIRKDGTLWVWGQNADGQLGNRTNTNLIVPAKVGNGSNWISVSGGAYHSLGIQSDGQAYVWGADNFGQLGLQSDVNQNSPISIFVSRWSIISAGENFSIGITDDGSLWGWGLNKNYQLNGVGGEENQNIPVQLSNDIGWKTVSTGSAHSLAIKNDGTLWGWGYNVFGQIIDEGVNLYKQPLVQIGTSSDWKSVSTGSYYSMAIKNDGTLWAWGLNFAGQLGNGSTIEQRVPMQVGSAADWAIISAGDAHSLGIKNDGTLWAWGSNISGQLGIGSGIKQLIPVQVGSASDWISIECGLSHSLGIKSDNTLWAWGKNSAGELGLGTNLNQSSPTKVGNFNDWKSVSAGIYQTMAIRGDGLLFVWGRNNYGQLGIGSTTSQNIPLQVGVANGWIAVESGGNHMMATDSRGILFGWGRNSEGQIGIGSFVTQKVPTLVSSGAATSFPRKLVSLNSSVTMQQGQYNIYRSNCDIMASVASNAQDRNTVSGFVTVNVWLESNQPSQYVKRHYEISSTNTSATSLARITLYFSQADFDAFNIVGGELPRDPEDVEGIAKLRIEKRGGTSSDNSGRPFTYNGTATTIDPLNTDIRWNATKNWWEVSLEISGSGGFFVKSTDVLLPVHLQVFEARQSESEAKLNWQTSVEYNASHFEVQRSANSVNFETIGRVMAAGTTIQQHLYSYTDRSFSNMHGDVYYRLRMVDLDSTFAFSRIVVVVPDPQFNMYPNPAPIGTMITVEAKTAISGLSVYDIVGRNLHNIWIQKQADTRLTIRLTGLSKGLYFIRFQAGGQRHVRTLSVQ